MNTWAIIWNKFHGVSTRRKVFAEVIRLAGRRDKIKVGAVFALFVFALVAVVISDKPALYFILFGISELYLLWLLDGLKDKAFFNEYGAPESSAAPPDTEDHRQSRYLIFKRALRDNHVSKSHVLDCFDLLDAKLDMESSRGQVPRKYISFVLGLSAGLVVAVARTLEVSLLLKTVGVVFTISVFVVLLLSINPSRVERLKELKYFMCLYCRETDQ